MKRTLLLLIGCSLLAVAIGCGNSKPEVGTPTATDQAPPTPVADPQGSGNQSLGDDATAE